MSVLSGGLAGTAAGWLIYKTATGQWPTASPAGEARENKEPVVEDSAAVDVVTRATESVVSIVVRADLSKLYNRTGPFFFGSPFDDFWFGTPFSQPIAPPTGKQKVGAGSGFIITADGLIVTNRHVVSEADADYTVVMSDGKQYEAKVLARDTVNDIAIIKIEADNLPVLDLGDSDKIKIGQTVIAIGNSLGQFSNTVTKGVISGINRQITAGDGSGATEAIDEAIQTDAAINPGNSGGPLLDLFGKVVGVNTAVSSQGQLIGFAIPVNSVKSVIESVQKYGRIVRTFLGVRYVLLTAEMAKANDISGISHGALVLRGEQRGELAVTPGSPADKAGLVENDIILEVNGEAVTVERSLARLLNKYKPGDKVKLKVYHKGSAKELEVELVERK